MISPSIILNNNVDLVDFDGIRLFMFTDDNLYNIAIQEWRKHKALELHYLEVQNGKYPHSPLIQKTLPLEARYALFHLANILWQKEVGFHFLDVGAFVGTVGIKMAHYMRANARPEHVFLFEPGKPFEILTFNIELNQIGDYATPFCCAITTYNGVAQLSWRPDSMDAAQIRLEARTAIENKSVLRKLTRIASDPRTFLTPVKRRRLMEKLFAHSSMETRLVPCKTLPTIIRELPNGKNLFIKLDIEGLDMLLVNDIYNMHAETLFFVTFEFTPSFFDDRSMAIEFLNKAAALFDVYDIFYAPNPAFVKRLLPAGLDAFVGTIEEERIHGYTDLLLIDKRVPDCADIADLLCNLLPGGLEYSL